MKHLLFPHIQKYSCMPKRKCVKSCRSLQHCNGVKRFKQVENQSRNHALRKRTCCHCMLIAENGNWPLCVYRLQHPTTSYTGLMRRNYSCSYVVKSIHEYLMETDLHLQISQNQARLKHENFTVSYRSYPTSLLLNILQLQLQYILVVHFTASTIWGLQKSELVGMVSYHYLHVPNYKMFLTLPKFEWSCFSWSNFKLGCCNLLKYL